MRIVLNDLIILFKAGHASRAEAMQRQQSYFLVPSVCIMALIILLWITPCTYAIYFVDDNIAAHRCHSEKYVLRIHNQLKHMKGL